jgi:hypothetical protein
MTKIQLIEDVKYLLEELPKKHINLFSLISKNEFETSGRSIIDEIKRKGYFIKYFDVSLLKLFSKIKDTHTKIFTNGLKVPIFFEFVDNSYYPFVIKDNLYRYLGRKLVAVDDIEINHFIKRIKKYIIYDNEEIEKLQIANSFRDDLLIKYISKSKQKLIKYTFEDGPEVNIKPIPNVHLIKRKSIYTIKGNEWLKDENYYWLEYKKQYLYIRYSKCKEQEGYSLATFHKDIKSGLSKRPKMIILDLRNNQGGHSGLFAPIITSLWKYITQFNPHIYCLINRKVFSSGILNTYDIKTKLGAILVGQPTGQGVNHYGEVKSFQLPNSKIEVQYSTKYFKITENDSTIINPDVLIEPTINDFMNGKDPVIDYCISSAKFSFMVSLPGGQ